MTRLQAKLVALLFGLLTGLWASPGFAADAALLSPIGYSQNLRYFAFEEFGIQDGSGFAYSDIFVIDLSEDRWVVGTPIRVVAETEDDGLSAVRARAAEAAKPLLDDLAVNVPPHLLASNADGEPDGDGKTLTFALPVPGGSGHYDERYTLQLEQYPSDASSPCVEWFGNKAVGFILTQTDLISAREVHRDNVLPRSRGCPADYRIHSVFKPFGENDVAHTVALIAVYAHGFEGLDRRFIAITLNKSLIGS